MDVVGLTFISILMVTIESYGKLKRGIMPLDWHLKIIACKATGSRGGWRDGNSIRLHYVVNIALHDIFTSFISI